MTIARQLGRLVADDAEFRCSWEAGEFDPRDWDADDLAYAREQLADMLDETHPTTRKVCAECGGDMFVTGGVSYHGCPEQVDHDADADHVAIDDSGYGD